MTGNVYRTDSSGPRTVVAGATLLASSPSQRQEVTSDAAGRYQFLALAPGLYRISLSKPGLGDDLADGRNDIELDRNSCEIRDFGMVADGRISGKVSSRGGKPAGGIQVQAFWAIDGKPLGGPKGTALTSTDGSYTVRPLPAGNYVVGVNADQNRDQSPYPPTTRPQLRLEEGAAASNVNIVLPSKRTATTILVKVVSPENQPFPDAQITLRDAQGNRRWSSPQERTSNAGLLRVPAYLGESYFVEAEAFPRLRGRAPVEVRGGQLTAIIKLRPE